MVFSPPEVGAIDAISALGSGQSVPYPLDEGETCSDAIMQSINNHTAMVHQMTPAVPPLYRPNQLASSTFSQVACRIVTKPTMETNLKVRYSTSAIHIRAYMK